MITDARSETLATERAPNDPHFEGAKTTAKLHPVIHVIDFSPDRVAEMQVLGHERKETSQAPNIAQIERAEIERNKKHFVRIDHNGIRFVPARGHPFAFRQKGETGDVSAIDVEPDLMFAANLYDLRNRIDACGRRCANGCDDGQWFEVLPEIRRNPFAQCRYIHS